MPTRSYIIVLISLLAFLILPSAAFSGTIGKGSAKIFGNNENSARQQALDNALRDAVKQGVGLYLDSQTQVKNWAVIRDEVFSSARGFVKSYNILRDEKSQGTWYIEIDAQVSSADIKDKLSELRILHQKMGNRRIMVLYRSTHPDALKDEHGAVTAVLSSMQTELLNYGFRVFDHRSLGHIYDQISQKGATTEEWVKIADQHQVHILIEFELVAGKKKPFSNSAFSAARVTLQAKSYDVSTGRLISNRGTSQKQMTNARVGSFDWDNALSKAGVRAGKAASDELTQDVIKYYETVGEIGNAYLMVFKDFTEEEGFEVLEIMENLEGYQSLSELENIPQLIKIEYFSSLQKSRLRRKLYLACKEKGIRLKTKKMSGNRFTFVKQ